MGDYGAYSGRLDLGDHGGLQWETQSPEQRIWDLEMRYWSRLGAMGDSGSLQWETPPLATGDYERFNVYSNELIFSHSC